MDRRDILKFGGMFLLPQLPNVAWAASNVNLLASRFFPSPDYNRLTLEFNNAPNFKSFVLSNPNRVVIDLPHFSNVKNLTNLDYKKYLENNIITNIRTGKFDKDTTRVVLELNKKLPIDPKIFILPPIEQYKHRLVIDLYLNDMSRLYLDDNLDNLINKLSAQTEKLEEPVIITSQPNSQKALKKQYVIAIDAGHGGEDPGAIGKKGTYEKNITLAIAKKLAAKINSMPGYKAVLTRTGDYYVPLHVRVAKARQSNADLFISIHADASPNRKPSGTSIYALSENGASSVTARWLARKENAADLIGGVAIQPHKNKSISKVLLDLSTTAQIAHSKILGQSILNDISSYNKLHKSQVEQAGFAVLKAPDTPSILIETGFISNIEEEKRLKNEQYQNKLVGSIVAGVDKYIRTYRNN